VLVQRLTAITALILLAACHREATTAPLSALPAPPTEALVGFSTTVDSALLEGAGVTILGTLASPPAARVHGDTAAFGRIATQPGVAYVLLIWIIQPGDSTEVLLSFRDRPAATDTLTDADRQLIASVGGRVKTVWMTVAWMDAVVPIWGIPALETSPAVTALDMGAPVWVN
jgi:hypothetical protein